MRRLGGLASVRVISILTFVSLFARHKSQAKVFHQSISSFRHKFFFVYIKQNQFLQQVSLILHGGKKMEKEKKWNRNNNKSKSKNNNTNRRNSFTHPQFVWLLLLPFFRMYKYMVIYAYFPEWRKMSTREEGEMGTIIMLITIIAPDIRRRWGELQGHFPCRQICNAARTTRCERDVSRQKHFSW